MRIHAGPDGDYGQAHVAHFAHRAPQIAHRRVVVGEAGWRLADHVATAHEPVHETHDVAGRFLAHTQDGRVEHVNQPTRRVGQKLVQARRGRERRQRLREDRVSRHRRTESWHPSTYYPQNQAHPVHGRSSSPRRTSQKSLPPVALRLVMSNCACDRSQLEAYCEPGFRASWTRS